MAILADEEGPAVVIVPVGRPGLAYARTGNLLLPVHFARQMPEWNRAAQQRTTASTSWRRSSRRPPTRGQPV